MEWIKAVKNLDVQRYKGVNLKILGHKVTYNNELIGRKYSIVYYVDGWNKGEWTDRNSEIGGKFGKPVYYRVKANEMRLWTALHGKKKAEKMKVEWKKKILLFHYKFNSTAELIRFLKSKKYQIEVIHEPADENM